MGLHRDSSMTLGMDHQVDQAWAEGSVLTELRCGSLFCLDLEAVFFRALAACLCTGTTGDTHAVLPQVLL